MVDRILRARYVREDQGWTLGENLAWGTGSLSTPRGAVEAWMNSPGHRANLLKRRYRDVGIGIVARRAGLGRRGRHVHRGLRRPAPGDPLRLTSPAAWPTSSPFRALHYDLDRVGGLAARRRPALRRHRRRRSARSCSPGRRTTSSRSTSRRATTPTRTPPRCSRGWREDGVLVARRRARAVGARAGLHRARRAAPHAPRVLRARARRGLRPRPHPPARAHAPRARRRTGSASRARRNANLSPIFSLYDDPAGAAWGALEPHIERAPWDEVDRRRRHAPPALARRRPGRRRRPSARRSPTPSC